MRLSKETIEHFANRGISVRWYPERTHEEYMKREWDNRKQRYIDWYKDHVRGCEAVESGRCNEVYESFEALEKRAIFDADIHMKYCDKCGYDDQMLYIEYQNGEKLIMKKESVKSKKITIEYIQKLIDKNEKMYSGAYGDFAIRMQKMLNKDGISGRLSIYPTTYGIGVWIFYNWSADKDVKRVTDIMDKYGIEYYNEYSDKRYVYRFKVSKKATNLAKIA